MNLINTKTKEYPCSLWQVRHANPNVSFSAEPTDEDLAPFDHANVYPSPQPTEYNQRTQRVEEGAPVLVDGRFQQVWQLRPATQEELAAWDVAHAPEPDWDRFRNSLRSDVYSAAFNKVFSEDSQAGIQLVAGLGLWEVTGKWGHFLQALLVSLQSIPIEQSSLIAAELLQLAFQCHLDPQFTSALEVFIQQRFSPTPRP